VNYANFGQSDLAAIYLKRAVELSNRISEREKLETFAAYYSVGTRELDKAIEAYQLWEKTYPDDRLAPANLADGYLRVGQYERCAAASRRAIKMDLIDSVAYENLAFCLINLDQLEEAKKVFDETLSRKLDVAGVRVPIYTLAFLQGDAPEMQKQLAWSAGRPGEEEAWFLSLQADTDAFYGRLGKAHEYSRRAVASEMRTRKKALLRIRHTQLCGKRSSEISPRRERMLRAHWLYSEEFLERHCHASFQFLTVPAIHASNCQ
jgi:tetratricopeptide (TPR) repeat protein